MDQREILPTKKSREYHLYYNSDTEPVLIGNNYDSGDGSNNHFNGMLDELRIYNRGLTPTEIVTFSKNKRTDFILGWKILNYEHPDTYSCLS